MSGDSSLATSATSLATGALSAVRRSDLMSSASDMLATVMRTEDKYEQSSRVPGGSDLYFDPSLDPGYNDYGYGYPTLEYSNHPQYDYRDYREGGVN